MHVCLKAGMGCSAPALDWRGFTVDIWTALRLVDLWKREAVCAHFCCALQERKKAPAAILLHWLRQGVWEWLASLSARKRGVINLLDSVASGPRGRSSSTVKCIIYFLFIYNFIVSIYSNLQIYILYILLKDKSYFWTVILLLFLFNFLFNYFFYIKFLHFILKVTWHAVKKFL